jgi:LmbE family N-acetylglucosaminyl deacetylase
MVQGKLEDMILSKQRLLVIMPHPDDEAFHCAGTMAKVKHLGGEVFLVIVNSGEIFAYKNGERVKVDNETRLSEISRSARFLNVDDWDLLIKESEYHLRLDTLPQRDLIELLEDKGKLAINRIKPTMVIIPFPSYTLDHRIVFESAFAALRPHDPSTRHFVRIVLSAECPHHCWSYIPFHPNVYIDISDYLDMKLKALSLHSSQLRPEPHFTSLENVERLARLRGSQVGVKAAEAFICHRLVL